MNSLRDVGLISLLAFIIATTVTTVHVGMHARVQVPLYDAASLDVSSMTDAELCALDHETLTGWAALREVGASGILALFGIRWLMSFLGVAVGCLLYARLRAPTPSQAAA